MGNASKIVADVRELASHALARVQRGSLVSPRLLDIDDAARYLSMSDKAIRELIYQGDLAYVQKIAGRSPFLIDIRDLDRWIEKNKIRAGE